MDSLSIEIVGLNPYLAILTCYCPISKLVIVQVFSYHPSIHVQYHLLPPSEKAYGMCNSTPEPQACHAAWNFTWCE